MGARVIDDVVITQAQAQLSGRRPGPRHLRGGHRCGQCHRSGRRGSAGQPHLAGRDGRQRDGAHERRHRRGRVDLPEPDVQEHQGGELLAPLDDAEQLHQRPAEQGSRAAVAQRRRRGGGGRELRRGRRPQRCRARARQRSVRDHGRRVRPRGVGMDPGRHDVPTWSAYGYTNEGFCEARRRRSRPLHGRSGPGGRARSARRSRRTSSHAGYMRLSGTSFSAPVVAGAAALLHIEHPTWTPDQIKGALMQRARYIRMRLPGSAGVGEINAYRSTLLTAPRTRTRH